MAHGFEVPREVREFAEKSVQQARQAVDGVIAAAEKTVNTLEGQATAAQSGTKDVSRRAVAFAEQNLATSFDYAQKLVQARDVQELMQIQAEFVRTQMQAMTEQARELGEVAGGAVQSAVQSKGRSKP